MTLGTHEVSEFMLSYWRFYSCANYKVTKFVPPLTVTDLLVVLSDRTVALPETDPTFLTITVSRERKDRGLPQTCQQTATLTNKVECFPIV